jgi:hypothetical protein
VTQTITSSDNSFSGSSNESCLAMKCNVYQYVSMKTATHFLNAG